MAKSEVFHKVNYEYGFYAVLNNFMDIYDAPFCSRADAEARIKTYPKEDQRRMRIIYVRNDPPENLPVHAKENQIRCGNRRLTGLSKRRRNLMDMNKIDVQEIAFHRNGICGVGFYAILFLWQPEDVGTQELFLGIVFDEPGECAVVGVDRLGTMGVKFAGGNSWRGDRFEKELREAIKGNKYQGDFAGPF